MTTSREPDRIEPDPKERDTLQPSPVQPVQVQAGPVQSARIQPGTKLSNYEIRSFIGAGGMASVYLAQDLRHNRPVAIKLMNMSLAATGYSERFRREIEIAARLSHPHRSFTRFRHLSGSTLLRNAICHR